MHISKLLGPLAILTLGLTACADQTIKDAEEEEPYAGGSGSGSGSDGGSGSGDGGGSGSGDDGGSGGDGGGSGGSSFTFEPAAIGINVDAGWDAEYGMLRYVYSNDLDGSVYSIRAELSVADTAYFSMTADDPDRRFHVCTFYADYTYIEHEFPPSGARFDYANGTGTIGSAGPLDYWTEGRADIYSWSAMLDDNGEVVYDSSGEVQSSETCGWLIENGYYELFDGMHIGAGYGPITDYIRESYWEDFVDTPEYEDSVVGSFVAMNHPNSEEPEGFDFIPYDWTTTIHFQGTSIETDVTDSSGETTTEQLIQVAVDTDNTLLFGDPDEPGLRRMFTYWYEDFPNLDLDILREGIPPELETGDGTGDEDTEEDGG